MCGTDRKEKSISRNERPDDRETSCDSTAHIVTVFEQGALEIGSHNLFNVFRALRFVEGCNNEANNGFREDKDFIRDKTKLVKHRALFINGSAPTFVALDHPCFNDGGDLGRLERLECTEEFVNSDRIMNTNCQYVDLAAEVGSKILATWNGLVYMYRIMQMIGLIKGELKAQG
jgi:hypothetical protein